MTTVHVTLQHCLLFSAAHLLLPNPCIHCTTQHRPYVTVNPAMISQYSSTASEISSNIEEMLVRIQPVSLSVCSYLNFTSFHIYLSIFDLSVRSVMKDEKKYYEKLLHHSQENLMVRTSFP